ncbi:G-actin binding protein, putative [Bodo saltans]|uniref:G-actin binding protein, putative n=1 Tax=Bodo saltans TaxID=75058 RepID=A0A0S4JJ86_BODSA|nr:G-actin binding protein, putative [Bodo saltans]|eukprot:CUG91607.1 G-actin binding protein, putative [Bodo saltans]
MSLTLAFPLGDSLRDALDKFKEPLAVIRAVIVGIDNETLVLHGAPIEATENLTSDLAAVRKIMPLDVPRFVMVKLEEKSFAEILYVPEGTKPKVKMLYAGSSAHLREQSRLAIATDTHVISVDEINPTLFGRDIEAERVELRTEKEKIKEEIAKMEIAPQRSAVELPAGTQQPLNAAAIDVVIAIKDKKLRAATFKLEGAEIVVDKTVDIAETSHESWISILPAEEPRFAVINFREDAIILLYLCPDSCKPKVKMPYAASKGSFTRQLTHLEAKPKKSVETSSAKGVDAVIDEALDAPQLEDDAKPIAPKSIMPKGPRMCM